MPRKVSSLKDFVNVFNPVALMDEDEQKEFYQPTAAVRNNRKHEFHNYLFERIEASANIDSRILVVGHGGCGKSTELHMLASKLRKAGILPIIINAREDLDLNDFGFVDIFMVIVKDLLQYANEHKLSVSERLISSIHTALSTTTTLEHIEKDVRTELGANLSTSITIPFISRLTAKIGASLKMNSGLREDLRREIKPKISDIVSAVNVFINDLNDKVSNVRNRSNIVVIIDGLEKCRQECVEKLFTHDASSLAAIKTHMVIAFPIGLYRSSIGGMLQSYFPAPEVMPMIKTHNRDSALSPYQEGIDVIKELVLKRADASFFDEGILENIIYIAGGSLRDTFYLLANSAFEAYMNDKERLDEASVDFVLNGFASDLFLRVNSKYYDVIRDIYDGDHEVRNKDALAELLYAGAVFEYNGEKWVDLHPLIRKHVSTRLEVLG